LAEAGLTGKGQAFDLILLDIRMPELDGLAATRLLRAAEARHGGTRRLPILAVTANVADSDRRAALAAGMDDCLAKPLERAALRGWIARIVSSPASALSA
jgi:CheY-like chemotaxis protein